MSTQPACPKCDETMKRRNDIAGNETHEWPCWSWACPWCGHEGRIHHRTTKRWPVAPLSSASEVFTQVSPNGVPHQVVRGRCATCGQHHPDWPQVQDHY